MNNVSENFVQTNSPDGGFLQSEQWRKFQESVGRKTFNISSENFWANIIEHELPIVGKYFYIPRGPVIPAKAMPTGRQAGIQSLGLDSGSEAGMTQLLDLAKKEKAGWIRLDPASEEILNAIKNSTEYKIMKAPHDMQPREILMLDITKLGEQLLAQMKPKTRYNIKLSEKRGVSIKVISESKKYINEFLRLINITACRDKITCHPESYYRKMLEVIPGNILRLYVAEYDSKVIAANLVIFYGKVATYLHGASDNEYRDMMAPHLLQWKQIQDARLAGCAKYDFGGVKINCLDGKSWAGVTRFKTGFSPMTKPTGFPGSHDIVIDRKRYYFYRTLQKIKNIINRK